MDVNFRLRMKGGNHLHATVRHGHGIVCRGIAGDLAIVGTGGGGKNVAGVDKVRTGGVSLSVGPAERDESGVGAGLSFVCSLFPSVVHSRQILKKNNCDSLGVWFVDTSCKFL